MEIGKSFRLTKRLGSGAFGEIFLGINTKTNTEVAIKIEKQSSPVPQLILEAEIYKKLLGDANYTDQGIPHVYYVASESDYNYMVMDKLGKSLEDYFMFCRKKFSLKTTMMIALQMLERIKFIHSKDIIHRDIKPDNFLMGLNYKSNKLFIIDFGLAKRVINKDNKHIPYRENKTLTGTARYASLNTHLGIEQSKRDDLECMMYCLIYFLKGSLPWMSLKAKNKKEKYDKIMEKKMTSKIENIVDGFPKELGDVLYYIRGLNFEEEPDYKFIQDKFQKIMLDNKINNDLLYDWVLLERKKLSNRSGSERSSSTNK